MGSFDFIYFFKMPALKKKRREVKEDNFYTLGLQLRNLVKGVVGISKNEYPIIID